MAATGVAIPASDSLLFHASNAVRIAHVSPRSSAGL